MKPILINLSGYSVPSFGVSLALGFVVSAFIFFKNTRQKFDNQDDAVKFITNNFLAWLGGARLLFVLQNWSDLPHPGAVFLPWQFAGLSFIGGILGLIIVNGWHQTQDRFRLWRLSDGATTPLLIFFLSFFTGQFLSSGQLFYATMIGIIALAVVLATWGLGAYRSLTWYPSGKIGFALLFSLSLTFLGFAGLAFFLLHALYLEAVLATGLGLTTMGWLYYRAHPTHQKQIDSLIKFFQK